MIVFHDRDSKNIDQINKSVGAQTERLESVAEKALESAGSLRDTIERDIRNIEETLKNHQEFSQNFVEALDENISGLSRKFSEQIEALGVEVE